MMDFIMSTMSIECGNQVWRNEAGNIHREDGPAFIRPDGYKAWYLNGKRHRLDGPAIQYSDGPAIIDVTGSHEWHVNGNLITKEVNIWIKENDFPDYTKWTDSHKMMFRLAFSGISS